MGWHQDHGKNVKTTKEKEKTSILKYLKKIMKDNFVKKKKKKKNVLPVLPFKENSLQPELSSPPRFRIQGGTLSLMNKRRTKEGNPCV